MRVMGILSGTSMDGIDVAVVDVAGEEGSLCGPPCFFATFPYSRDLRDALEEVALAGREVSARWLASLNVAVGEAFSEAASRALREVAGVELIGSHGQTVAHDPSPPSGGGRPATLQIGEPTVIAQRTGLTVVANFRSADVAAGGQGAPLVPLFDFLTLRSPDESRAILNLGGIANLTLLPAGCIAGDVRAFDTGPANMPLDEAVRFLFDDAGVCDRDGRIAAQGKINDDLVTRLLADPYFSREAPKSAGAEQFGSHFVTEAVRLGRALGLTEADIVASLTDVSARSIIAALPAQCERLIVSGGGTHNPFLMGRLTVHAARSHPRLVVETSDRYGIPVDAKEAMAFAVLAYRTLHGCCGTLPTATGAREAVVAGTIVPGKNYTQLMRAVWGAASRDGA
jgi:anhydro-N-acetylmuramic acid kinase